MRKARMPFVRPGTPAFPVATGVSFFPGEMVSLTRDVREPAGLSCLFGLFGLFS